MLFIYPESKFDQLSFKDVYEKGKRNFKLNGRRQKA